MTLVTTGDLLSVSSEYFWKLSFDQVLQMIQSITGIHEHEPDVEEKLEYRQQKRARLERRAENKKKREEATVRRIEELKKKV